METIDAKNIHGTATAYVTNSDINMMNSAWFTVPGHTSKPSTKESFTTMNGDSNTLKGSSIDYSPMPNDLFIKIYMSSLGLLGLYIFLKMVLRKRLM